MNMRAQISSDSSLRWDQKIIEEAHIWNNLLVNYMYADAEKYWPERNEALESIVFNYPLSKWADDAALLLAGVKASVEKDISGAIKDLRVVIQKYPDAATVVENWYMHSGFRLNEAWVMYAPNLVICDSNNKVIRTFPFDANENISIREQETLAFFDHLNKHPNYTKHRALYTIVLMLLEQGNIKEAIAELEALLNKSSDFYDIIKNDMNASKAKNGFRLESVPPFNKTPVNRVQYDAMALLCELYLENNNNEKALELTKSYAEKCGSRGWLWNYNLFFCRQFIKMDELKLAEKQLGIAEKGIASKIDRTVKRQEKIYEEKELPISAEWKTSFEQSYKPVYLEIEKLKQDIKEGL